jgi:methyl-accepting chemotaxis protein
MGKMKDRETKDLQEIIDGLARVANGDFSTKIKLSGSNADLAAIAKSFNEMISEIRNAADDTRDSLNTEEDIRSQ